MKTNGFIIRAYKVKELAFIYKVSKPTLKKWLQPFRQEIGNQIGHFYTGPQVRIILDKLGAPDLSYE